MVLTLLAIVAGYYLGQVTPNLWGFLESLAERLASQLPETTMLPITPQGSLPLWAIRESGYHMVRTSQGWESQYLTPYMVWCMDYSSPWGLPMKSKFRNATVITGYEALTPTKGRYTRKRTERVFRLSMEVC